MSVSMVLRVGGMNESLPPPFPFLSSPFHTSHPPLCVHTCTHTQKVIINKHNNEAQMNRYWTDLMSGVQLDALPAKDISFVRDFLPLVQSITVKDLQVRFSVAIVRCNVICCLKHVCGYEV